MNEQISIPEQIKQLITGQLSDKLSAEDLKTLKKWIDESPGHKRYFNEIRYTWALADQKVTSRDHGKSILKLSDRMKRSHHTFWTWQRVAASWAIVFIGSWILYWATNKTEIVDHNTVATTTTIHARMGSQTMVDMPDKSRVWLNGGSKLAYGSSYGEQDREVQLTGEACFDVKNNPEKPFVVKAGNLSIKALGTTFNVKAYPEDKTITTTLVKGKVTIEGNDEDNKTFSYEMRPNEKFTYTTEHTTIKQPEQNQTTVAENPIPEPEPVVIEKNIKTELYTSWKDDLWVIEKQKLGVLAKDFERRYNVRIVFSSENAANYHFSGTIQRETIEQVMTILGRTLPLKYSFDKDLITIDVDKKLVREFLEK